ncbi:helix-turn-helix domain-containing protein [Gordonia sp. N1V]|uniref:helix-turn-helix transcriptional regulator n=1 Tax=Gordonia sp. N1V TaxID=3034163 RepID=UPI0023E098EB|nr:helix-turn-helix domain-containing protein [Gordonia sp. N1V]MDF3283374.1 helix-turn-helix domain-containing protein [Gordonia sp. N1V]
MAPDDRLLVPITDTQTLLGGLGRTTIYELAEAGELTRVRIGTRSFITAESIHALIERNTEATPDSAA